MNPRTLLVCEPLEGYHGDPYTLEAVRGRYHGQTIGREVVARIHGDIAMIGDIMRMQGHQTPGQLHALSYLYAVLAECIEQRPELGRMQ